jgi:hypothetical protein
MSKAQQSQQTAPAVAQTSAVSNAAPRHLLFISHANPQDNAAAAWFATQLTLMGYEVWCDVKNVHAGESSFWLKIQKKIENETAKFIFILSNTSRDFEKKPGVYKEVQTADNLRRNNFIMPLRIEKLTGSAPILISPDLYIPSENWAEGLRELHKRLVNDGVPRLGNPDYARIASWWPAVSARDVIVRDRPSELSSNLLPFISLPENVHIITVASEGNRLTGREQLKGALPAFPVYSAHGDFAISFGSAADYHERTHGFDIIDAKIIPTSTFLNEGDAGLGVIPSAAKNMLTYFIAASLEKMLIDKGLSNKSLSYSRRKIWFADHGLLKIYSFDGPNARKTRIHMGGKITSLRRIYAWHFAIQPAVDLRLHYGVVLSPKAIISKPYRIGEKPYPLDEKRALRKLGWWNHEWRTKLTALVHWIADGGETIAIPTGYQDAVLAATPEVFWSDLSYLEKDDDDVVREIIRAGDDA